MPAKKSQKGGAIKPTKKPTNKPAKKVVKKAPKKSQKGGAIKPSDLIDYKAEKDFLKKHLKKGEKISYHSNGKPYITKKPTKKVVKKAPKKKPAKKSQKGETIKSSKKFMEKYNKFMEQQMKKKTIKPSDLIDYKAEKDFLKKHLKKGEKISYHPNGKPMKGGAFQKKKQNKKYNKVMEQLETISDINYHTFIEMREDRYADLIYAVEDHFEDNMHKYKLPITKEDIIKVINKKQSLFSENYNWRLEKELIYHTVLQFLRPLLFKK